MTHTYNIPAMDCPAEESLIRNRLRSEPGISSLTFDLFNRRLTVDHSFSDDAAIVAALRSIGMQPAPEAAGPGGSCCGPDGTCAVKGGPAAEFPGAVISKRELVFLGVSGALAVAAEAVSFGGVSETSALVIALAAGSILFGGLPTLKKGLVALRTFTLNINFLMSVAVIGAAAIGQWPEAAMVVFLFAVAELIEAYSLDRARNAVKSLMAIAPTTATVQDVAAPDQWREVPAAGVPVGSLVRVKPGERIPLDGLVVTGTSAVNQAPITGESVPVDKVAGDQVFAGTINGNGLLELRTTGGHDQTTLARIIRTVQEAQGQRAPTQRFVDSFARVYTPIVVALAVLVAVVPWVLFHEPFLTWLYRALVLLVIGCPCALVISTPVTVVSGLAAAARRGILVKGGVYLEQGRNLRIIALDKTGTVTEGRPKLSDVVPLGDSSKDDVLRVAASLDAHSDHPVAQAIARGWTGPLLPAAGVEAIPGRGMAGLIDGDAYMVGNHRLAEERGVCSPIVEQTLRELEANGRTTVVVASATRVLGALGVADAARETSVAAINELHGLGMRTAMLTGDNQATADAIAREVGIDDARGSLLPEDKLKAVDELLAQYGETGVGMVGDGINDAPALARASIGFAMGAAGTDTAMETADIALMQDDLRGVPEFIRLSRRTSNVLRQNIGAALGIKLVFFALALAGMATLWMAVVADVGASLLVVVNGLRLMRSPRGRQGR